MYKAAVTYFIKKPSQGKRATFAIIRRREGKNETLRPPELEGINKNLAVLGLTQAELQVRDLVSVLRKAEEQKKGKYVASEENQKLFRKYWEEVYEPKKIRSKEAAYNGLRWALSSLGGISLLGDSSTLQRHVDNHFRGRSRGHKRAIGVLNQLRAYFGIPQKLQTHKEEQPEFRYLTHLRV